MWRAFVVITGPIMAVAVMMMAMSGPSPLPLAGEGRRCERKRDSHDGEKANISKHKRSSQKRAPAKAGALIAY
jgi:hypothetical protein